MRLFLILFTLLNFLFIKYSYAEDNKSDEYFNEYKEYVQGE